MSRHSAGVEDIRTQCDGRVDRESAGRSLAIALRRIVLDVLIGEEMCLPLFRLRR